VDLRMGQPSQGQTWLLPDEFIVRQSKTWPRLAVEGIRTLSGK
jgi:hypothetical protein